MAHSVPNTFDGALLCHPAVFRGPASALSPLANNTLPVTPQPLASGAESLSCLFRPPCGVLTQWGHAPTLGCPSSSEAGAGGWDGQGEHQRALRERSWEVKAARGSQGTVSEPPVSGPGHGGVTWLRV